MVTVILAYGAFIVFYTVRVSWEGCKYRVKHVWAHVLLYYMMVLSVIGGVLWKF